MTDQFSKVITEWQQRLAEADDIEYLATDRALACFSFTAEQLDDLMDTDAFQRAFDRELQFIIESICK